MRSAHVARADARGERDSIDDERARAEAARRGRDARREAARGGGARARDARAPRKIRETPSTSASEGRPRDRRQRGRDPIFT
jgi:hypothetical protein